jgi:hypothetical protein
MIFGLPTRFAIECEIDPTITHAVLGKVFGSIVIWAGGKRLGERDVTVMLTLAGDFFADSLRFQGQRRDEALDGKKATEVWTTSYGAAYGEGGASVEECLELGRRYRKFFICPGGSEAFDGEFAVLLEQPNGARFIWRDFEDKQIREVLLEPGEYESVVRAFLAWFTLETGYRPAVPE